jgi:hypothetical protein
MAIISYPIPYETVGVTGRMTRPRWFQVSDKMELEVREIEGIESLEVARANFSWATQGLPGQGDYNEDNPRHRINPTSSISLFEDRLYAPVRKFSANRYQDEEAANLIAKAADIGPSIGSFEHVLAQPFERLYREQERHNGNLYSKHRYGSLKSLDQLRLTGDSEVKAKQARDEAISAAKDDLSAYVVIDGDLWRRLFTEPVIALTTISNIVDIKLVLGTDVGADKTDYFNLNQLDECLEFVETKYPGYKVRQHFSDLSVMTPEAFTFDGEADAVVRAARNVDRAIGRGAAFLEGEFQTAYDALHDLVWNRRDRDAEEFATALENLNDTWTDEGLTSVARESRSLLQLAMTRWDMRPIRKSSLFL